MPNSITAVRLFLTSSVTLWPIKQSIWPINTYTYTHTYIHIQAYIFIYLHTQLNRDLVISGNNPSENYAQIGVRLLLELLCTDSLEYQLCLKLYLSLSPSLLELIFKALPCSICYDSSQLMPSSRQTRWIILNSHTNTHTIHT